MGILWTDWVKAGEDVAPYRRIAQDAKMRAACIREHPEKKHLSTLSQIELILTANIRMLALLKNDITGRHREARDELETALSEITDLRSRLSTMTLNAESQRFHTVRKGAAQELPTNQDGTTP